MKKLKKVLLVDDESTVNFINKAIMERSGFAIEVLTEETVDGAFESLQLAEGNHDLPELIFVDINMPEKTGWDFIETFKSISFQSPRPKVIFLSSSLNPSDKVKALDNTDVIDFISKPISKDKLKEITTVLIP